MFQDKTVCLVGNGPVVEAAPYIDACDVVIRCNRYHTHSIDRGTKTTHQALNPTATRYHIPDLIPILVARPDELHLIPEEFKTSRLWDSAFSNPFCDPDGIWLEADYLETIAAGMEARPTLGWMLLSWLFQIARHRAPLRIAGFSWSNEGMSKVYDLTEEKRLFDQQFAKEVIVL